MYVLCGGGDLSDTVVGQITAAGTTQRKVSERLWLHAMGVSRAIRPHSEWIFTWSTHHGSFHLRTHASLVIRYLSRAAPKDTQRKREKNRGSS